MHKLKFAGLWALLAVAAALPGCGSGVSVYPAKGKIVYTDGSPLAAGAQLILDTPGANYRVWGDVKPDGSFSLVTYDEQGTKLEGAPVGKFQAYLVPVDANATGGDEDDKDPVEVAAEKYSYPDKSGITVEIKAVENNVIPDIKVEKPARR